VAGISAEIIEEFLDFLSFKRNFLRGIKFLFKNLPIKRGF
jgi:hypothetical protein